MNIANEHLVEALHGRTAHVSHLIQSFSRIENDVPLANEMSTTFN